MKKVFVTASTFVVLFIIWLVGIWSVVPGPGSEAVLIHKPMLYGKEGVDTEPVRSGRRYVWFTTQIVYVNMQPQAFPVDFDDAGTKTGVPLDFHAVMRLQVTNSPKLIQKFGDKWYGNNVLPAFTSMVRDEVKRYEMDELVSGTDTASKLDEAVATNLRAFITKEGMPIVVKGVTMGRANPPKEVLEARVATAAQQQRIKTEEQKVQAEVARALAEQKRALADQAYRSTMGLSPAQFVDLEKIRMMGNICPNNKCVVMFGNQPTPTVTVQ